MRYLILSDIHGNLEALDAVLDVSKDSGCQQIIVLGDLVGYGADPNAVVERVMAMRPAILIRGNHDKVASGIEDPEHFNYMAAEAARWTHGVLTPENRTYLADLPPGPVIVNDLLQVCHGAPDDEDAYVFDELDALRVLQVTRRPVCLFGHTHLPIAFVLTADQFEIVLPHGDGETLVTLETGRKYLINPGSVGQPRDGDPRAAYAVLDEERHEVLLHRTSYDVATAQAKVRSAGLPEALARRLALGR